MCPAAARASVVAKTQERGNVLIDPAPGRSALTTMSSVMSPRLQRAREMQRQRSGGPQLSLNPSPRPAGSHQQSSFLRSEAPSRDGGGGGGGGGRARSPSSLRERAEQLSARRRGGGQPAARTPSRRESFEERLRANRQNSNGQQAAASAAAAGPMAVNARSWIARSGSVSPPRREDAVVCRHHSLIRRSAFACPWTGCLSFLCCRRTCCRFRSTSRAAAAPRRTTPPCGGHSRAESRRSGTLTTTR